MKTQILISINSKGLGDISLIAENEKECDKVIDEGKQLIKELKSSRDQDTK